MCGLVRAILHKPTEQDLELLRRCVLEARIRGRHATGKDGVSMGRPFRYAINTYCLKHTETIEFRRFRATVKRQELESQFRFAVAFLDAALNGGPTVKEILAEG